MLCREVFVYFLCFFSFAVLFLREYLCILSVFFLFRVVMILALCFVDDSLINQLFILKQQQQQHSTLDETIYVECLFDY